eukprot:SAG11_NODE_2915_length_2841_cov_1.755653_2_plen_139_part_00
MYNRALHQSLEEDREFEKRLKMPAASRRDMLKAAARKKQRDETMAQAYHSRAESWLSRTADEIRSGKVPEGPSYKTKNHAHHHRFRDRRPELELGPMRVSANHYILEKDVRRPPALVAPALCSLWQLRSAHSMSANLN